MHPLSDKDLDRLSREAAEQCDVEQNTSGWEKLEQKLNKQLPQTGKKERRRFLFLLWFLALLSGGSLLWMLTGSNGPQLVTLKQGSSTTASPVLKDAGADPSIQNKGDNSPQQPENTNPGIKTGEETTKHTQRTRSIPGSTGEQRERNVPENAILSGNKKIRSRNADLQKVSTGTSKDNNARPDTRKNGKLSRGNNGSVPLSNEPIQGSRRQSNTTGTNEESRNSSLPTKPVSPPVTRNEEPSLPDTLKQSTARRTNEGGPDTTSTTQSNDSLSTTKKAAKNKGEFKKGLEIGAVAAPDMSNVKFTSTDQIGFNVGIQLGYRFSQRWSLNTGVLYTRKNYTARGKDFNPPKGSWLDNVSLDEVEGSCFMFDIPLNVRYDLNDGNNLRYFLSTGLSTYFMKKESYDYYYRYTNGSAGSRYRSYPSEERHWFSVLNISAGFENKFSRRFSWQVEPYLKVPLTGVGYGNIQLNSYGMYLSLKYKAGRGSGKN